MKIALILLGLFTVNTVQADALKIAAIVGKAPITMLDYEERLIFTIATSGMQNTPEARKQIGPQVLNALIEEKLKLQEAEKYKIEVSNLDISREWDRIEKQNNVPDGQIQRVIMQLGIRPEVFRDQLRADIAWFKYIGARYRPTVNVGESEIKQHLEKIKKVQNKPFYLISEIVLPFEGASDKMKTFKTAQHLSEQLKSGANFQALAQEVSQGRTAEKGGDLGWVSAQHLVKKVLNHKGKKIGDIIAKMKKNEVSGPLELDDGIHLVLLRDLKKGKTEKKAVSEVGYKIRQLILPIPGKKTASDKAATKRRLDAVRRMIQNADDMSAAQRQVGGLQPPERWVTLDEFEKPVQDALKKLKIDEVTPVLEVQNSFTLFMLSAKNDKMDASTRQRERIKDELTSTKLHMLSRRHLRDLKSASHIDIRHKI